jgi:O-acetyl-ADP-ribose deacetylase (regulator of RNase III)
MSRPQTQRIEILTADITTLAVDAIVNAANESLAPGGGVCGAIHRKAGPKLGEACAGIAPCRTGSAVLTPGFNLPAANVIHAVGPVWHGGNAGEAELLAGCYRASLHLCEAHKLGSIAFPAISTGIFGYPLAAATAVAMTTVMGYLASKSLPARVVFCCFDESTAETYWSALRDAAR